MKTFAPMTTSLVLLTLYLLLRSVVSDNNTCGVDRITPGWTIPNGNIVIELGSPLEIYCVLDLNHPVAKGYTAKDLIFMNSSQLINQKYVTLINKTTARLYIENVTLFEGTFFCKLCVNESKSHHFLPVDDLTNWQRSVCGSIVCGNVVSVGRKPQGVTDFLCLSYNWEILNCTWHQPFNGVETIYRVAYQVKDRSGRKQLYQCPIYEEEKCIWTLYTDRLYRLTAHYMIFVIKGSNRFGNITQEFEIEHFTHIIPAAPKGLTAVNETSSSIYLEWSISAHFLRLKESLIYEVGYTSGSSAIWNISFYNAEEVEQNYDYVRLNVSGLKANMMYNFTISMKIIFAAETYWSPSASLAVKTKSCPPYHSPKADIGSFHITPIGSTSREISVFWKPIPDDEHNGDDFRYEITVSEGDQAINVKPSTFTSWFAKFTDLSLNSYQFCIRAANANGYAPYCTFVNVPSKSDLIPKPVWFGNFYFGKGIYKLSWKLSHRRDYMITSYTLFSCKNNEEWPYKCVSLDWVQLTSLHTEIYARRNYSSPTFDPKFDVAISVNTASSSSGMMWASSAVIRSIPGEISSRFQPLF